MLAQQYYQDAPPSPASRLNKLRKAKSGLLRKDKKINAVSKASLAMLDPRHAFGIDVGTQWCNTPTVAYNARWSQEEQRRDHTPSPTPTLQAFAASPIQHEVLMERTGTSDAFSSVFKDDRQHPRRVEQVKAPKTSNGIAKFFTWKQKKRPTLTSKSTPDLFDVPQSVPPTVTTFDIPPLPKRSYTFDGEDARSFPCSPVRTQVSLPRAYGANRDTMLIKKQSMPALRESKFVSDRVPALPPLPSSISPIMLPEDYKWGQLNAEEERRARAQHGGRMVSSTGRGVAQGNRKSTIILKSEKQVRKDLMIRATPMPRAGKRMSVAQHVVDGLLSHNHSREEPAMSNTVAERASRRRSKSVESRVPPPLAKFGSPPTGSPMVAEMPVFPNQAHKNKPPRPTRARSPSPQPKEKHNKGETMQARRVNLSNQRVRAVAVSSLNPRSPRLYLPAALPVVNVMPPTPNPEFGIIPTEMAAPVLLQEKVPAKECQSPESAYSNEGRFSVAYGGLDGLVSKEAMDLSTENNLSASDSLPSLVSGSSMSSLSEEPGQPHPEIRVTSSTSLRTLLAASEETPTLESCARLDLDMDLADLAKELGLGSPPRPIKSSKRIVPQLTGLGLDFSMPEEEIGFAM